MNKESTLAIEIWEIVRDNLPTVRRLDTAVGLLKALEDYGFDARDLQDVIDEEPYLTRAYRDVFDEDYPIEIEDDED